MNLQIFAGQTVEVDPFRVSSPDSRWLVFHRRVWRNNQRYLQGFVVNSERFFEALVQNPAKKRLYSTETVLHSEIRKDAQILPSVFSYQADLPPPLDGYRLVLSASSLPSHPTASLFIGMAVLMSVLLLGGAYAVYRIVSTEMVLSKKKSDFVASVSHELRTPLTSIRMFSEMLTDRTDLSDSKQAAYLKRIREESERLSRLVEGVLTLARIENNEWKIKLTQTNPEAVIRQVVERLDETVRTMGFELQLVKGSGPISDVAIDADAFSQMLTNLIENGVKFSKDAGTKRIEINLTQEADDCVVGVRDYGIGISPEEKKRIFERFYRAENEMTRHTRGTGIGLAMVKMLADRQNIQLDLVSYDPGTEFVLRLPAFQAST